MDEKRRKTMRVSRALVLGFAVLAAAFVLYAEDVGGMKGMDMNATDTKSKDTKAADMKGMKMGCMGMKGMEMGKKCKMGSCPLMGDDRAVVVTDTKDGVQIVITAKDKKNVKELQEQIRSCVAMREKMKTKEPAVVNKEVRESKLDGNPDDMVQCPVSGEKFMKKKAFKVYEYKGKKYYMCCPMCAAPFTADPEEYIKK